MRRGSCEFGEGKGVRRSYGTQNCIGHIVETEYHIASVFLYIGCEGCVLKTSSLHIASSNVA
jgi:hypothetical protein